MFQIFTTNCSNKFRQKIKTSSVGFVPFFLYASTLPPTILTGKNFVNCMIATIHGTDRNSRLNNCI